MENDNQQQVKSFYRILEEGIAKLPADVRGALYRPCAVDCVKDVVLTELRRQFEECGCDLDRQYTKYGRSEYFFADVIEPGRVYEVGYPRCLCPQVDAGFVDSAAHCECSRQSILYVLEELLPGRDIRVEELETVLSGGEKVRMMLSRMMLFGSNVLVIDQPTNHLDLESITAVNNGVRDFKGTVLFASHDHEFVQTIANRIMVLEDGKLTDRLGTYEDYIASMANTAE